MKKILILTVGSKQVAFGHLTRCLSLYQAFVAKGEKPEFILSGDDAASDLLSCEDYRMYDWLGGGSELLEMVRDCDIVIVDSYLAEKSLYEKISDVSSGKLVVIDDYNRLDYPKGVVINPSIYGDDVGYEIREGVSYLTGSKYIVLRKEFWDVPEKNIKQSVKDILITSGGVMCPDFMCKIIDPLKEKYDFNFHIIDTSINRLSAKDILSLMLEADICISGGGQTINELARVGTPTIGICFYENQRMNIEAWGNTGFIDYEGWYCADNLLERIEASIKGLLPYNERIKRSRIGKAKVDGMGGRRISEFLLELN